MLGRPLRHARRATAPAGWQAVGMSRHNDNRSAVSDVSRYESLLGEPIVVADPRITGAQAARVLGITPAQVRSLVARGRLPRHSDRGRARQFRLSDVRFLEEPITVDQAAEIWTCNRDEAHETIARGSFSATGDARRPLRRVDADLEHGRRRTRSNAGDPGRTLVERDHWSSTCRRAAGWLGTAEVAETLGIAPSYARRLAVDGRLPAERDAFGRWWAEADRIQLIADARAWQREHGRSPTTWPARRGKTRDGR